MLFMLQEEKLRVMSFLNKERATENTERLQLEIHELLFVAHSQYID